MAKDNGNDSLIFKFYHQYLKKEKGVEKKNPDIEPETDFDGEPPTAAVKGAIETLFSGKTNKAETDKEAPQEAESDLPDPEAYRYLEPLFDVDAFMHEDLEEKSLFDPIAFHERVFSMIMNLPDYPEFQKEAERFAKDMSQKAELLLKKLYKRRQTRLEMERNQTEHSGSYEEPIDSDILIKITNDGMYAFLFILPPFDDGKEASAGDIEEALEKRGVVYGIRETELPMAAGRYMQIVLIAQGTAAIPGKDGEVIEKYPRTAEINILQDDTGKADFKNINSVQFIEKDAVLCEIIPPTDGVCGTSVDGKEILPKAGIVPPVPAGKNTLISDDGARLIAAAGGQLIYRNNHFDITEVLSIKENVDYSVGNLDYPGDIVIHGEVRAGFVVKATGNITIYGMVEGASIISQGDVILKKGMNGNHNGQIHAQGEVKASYLENCTVYATGAVSANSIISCHIFCGDSVTAQGSIGAIIGGSVTALRSVTARMIGSKSRRETIITLGSAPHLITEKAAAEKELKEIAGILDKLDKNVIFLRKNKDSLAADKLPLLDQLEQQQRLYYERNRELTAKMEEYNSRKTDFSQCRVQSNMIFPPTKICIGPFYYVFETVSSKCDVFMTDEEIRIGTMS